MKLNELMGQVKAAKIEQASKATLTDVLGKGVKVIQPLSAGPDDGQAYYVVLNEVKPLENGIQLLVTPELENKQYSIKVNINNRPDMFVANLEPLCGQFGIDVLTVEALQSKVGQGFYVLAVRNGSFVNYSFNINRISAWIQG